MTVSFNKPDNMETYYVATLSDGRDVYEDNLDKRSSWLRLKDFVCDNGLDIIGLRIDRNGVSYPVPNMAKGYFYGKKRIMVWPNVGQKEYFGIGWYDGDVVTITWWLFPGMKTTHTEIRSADKSGFSLIINEHKNI